MQEVYCNITMTGDVFDHVGHALLRKMTRDILYLASLLARGAETHLLKLVVKVVVHANIF